MGTKGRFLVAALGMCLLVGTQAARGQAPDDSSPSFGNAVIANQNYAKNRSIGTVTLPPATGGDGALTYALTPALPVGLAFDPVRRTLSGTPVEARAAATYTYTATDSDVDDPDSASLTFTITVTGDDLVPSFGDAAIRNQEYVQNTPIETLRLPAATGGDGALTYALEPALPAGLAFDPATRTLSGTPREAGAAVTYRYTATDADIGSPDSASLTFTITVRKDLAPSFGDAVVADQNYAQNTPIDALTLPAATGGDGALTYALEPAPPVGLAFDAATRTLSGTPREAGAAVTYTYTATDADAADPDSASLTFAIAVTGEDLVPSFGDAVIADQSYTENTPIDALTLPAATGGDGPLTYALEPALPAGLAFDAATRTLSGTPREAGAAVTYTYTATDADAVDPDSASLTFAIAVGEDLVPSFGDAAIADQSYTENTPIDALTLPAATGGDGPLTYALEPAPPVGLAFDAATRTLSGTPREAGAAVTYTYTATDADAVDPDSASLTFAIAVGEDLVPSFGAAAIADQSYTENTPIDALTLPAATGGDGALTYALEPAPPAGLAFDAATRTLSGTPREARAARTYTYTATATGATGSHSTSLTFVIVVAADSAPSFGAARIADLRLRRDGAMEPLVLPEATGGDGPLTYALRPDLPVGLRFDPATRVLSGMPSEVAAARSYRYSATDSDATAPDAAELSFTIEVVASVAEAEALNDALAAHARALLWGAARVIGDRFRAPVEAVRNTRERPRRRGRVARRAALGGMPEEAISGAGMPGGVATAASAGLAWGQVAAPVVGFPRAGFNAASGVYPAPSADGLLWGHSFAWPFNVAWEDWVPGQWTLWGTADAQYFEGTSGVDGRYDGRMMSLYVGVDARFGEFDNWLAGAALSRSQGDADYFAGGRSGRLRTTLTAAYPYVSGRTASGIDLWGLGGVGTGEAENGSDRAAGRPETADLDMWLAMVGLRWPLREGTLGLALLGDMGFASLTTDDGDQAIDGLEAMVSQLQVALEASYTLGALSPYLQLGGRVDGGDGLSGAGLEMVAGLRYAGARLSFDARGRWMAAHAASGHEEAGAMVTASLRARPDGSGLWFRLAPSWGIADRDRSAFLGDDGGLGGGAMPAFMPRSSWGARDVGLNIRSALGYGVRTPRLHGVLTPTVSHDRGFGYPLTRIGVEYRLSDPRREALDLGLALGYDLAEDEERSGYQFLLNVNSHF